MIDWSKPLEAVHEDGRTAPMVYRSRKGSPQLPHLTEYGPDPETSNNLWSEGGKNGCPYSRWRIRNVATPAAVPKYSPVLVERMVALVKTMSIAAKEEVAIMGTGQNMVYSEARTIVALLPALTDPDLIEAREIVAKWYEDDGRIWEQVADAVRSGSRDTSAPVACALAGIKRGKGEK